MRERIEQVIERLLAPADFRDPAGWLVVNGKAMHLYEEAESR